MRPLERPIRTLAALCALLGPAAALPDGAPPPSPAEVAPDRPERPAREWMDEGYRRKAAGDLGGAALAFVAARDGGFDPQRVELELGYVALRGGDAAGARTHLDAAQLGADPGLAAQARAELAQLPGATWRDLYSEIYGWSRASGALRTSDAVPTLRLRAGLRPWPDLDLGPYLYAQGTRDLASRSAGAAGQPRILADDAALVGAGVRWRGLGGRLGLFLQAGLAVGLLDDGRKRTAFDVRGGAQLALETSRCWPTAAQAASAGVVPCAELYSEIVYLRRFADDVVGLARGRVSATLLVAGPWALQLAAEARVAADRNGDFYDNLVDAGIGPRFRLLRPFHLDVFPTFGAGTYLGRHGRDPAPSRLSYAELRLQVATSLEF